MSVVGWRSTHTSVGAPLAIFHLEQFVVKADLSAEVIQQVDAQAGAAAVNEVTRRVVHEPEGQRQPILPTMKLHYDRTDENDIFRSSWPGEPIGMIYRP